MKKLGKKAKAATTMSDVEAKERRSIMIAEARGLALQALHHSPSNKYYSSGGKSIYSSTSSSTPRNRKSNSFLEFSGHSSVLKRTPFASNGNERRNGHGDDVWTVVEHENEGSVTPGFARKQQATKEKENGIGREFITSMDSAVFRGSRLGQSEHAEESHQQHHHHQQQQSSDLSSPVSSRKSKGTTATLPPPALLLSDSTSDSISGIQDSTVPIGNIETKGATMSKTAPFSRRQKQKSRLKIRSPLRSIPNGGRSITTTTKSLSHRQQGSLSTSSSYAKPQNGQQHLSSVSLPSKKNNHSLFSPKAILPFRKPTRLSLSTHNQHHHQPENMKKTFSKTKHLTRGAWMCGLCGLAFPSLAYADRHERLCIRSAFRSLSSIKLTSLLQTKQNTWLLTDDPQNNTLYFHRALQTININYNTTNKALITTIPTQIATLLNHKSIDMTNSMRRCVLMTDEALIKVVRRAHPHIINRTEMDCERSLALLSRDRSYYQLLYDRMLERQRRRLNNNTTNRRKRIRQRLRRDNDNINNDDNSKYSDGGGGIIGGVLSKVKNRFVEAYDLIKEGDSANDNYRGDQYKRQLNSDKKGDDPDMQHTESTLFVNVIVKNSVKVVNNELERLAKQRWVTSSSRPQQQEQNNQFQQTETLRKKEQQFEKIRELAHVHMVKLAAVALASDFTPRRIAIQLSNDLYRLVGPQLKSRGVTIESELEYRVGAFFVLSVNILKIDWVVFMEHVHREMTARRKRWEKSLARKKMDEEKAEEDIKDDTESNSSDNKGRSLSSMLSFIQERVAKQMPLCFSSRVPSKFEMLGQFLALLHHFPALLSVPLCTFFYVCFFRSIVHTYIVTMVTDDIFRYVENKGMEMDLQVKEARHQASFMLAALRELRQDERKLQKKKADAEAGVVDDADGSLGPILGPAIEDDNNPAVVPEGWAEPTNLDMVNLEIDLPVGFKRLRWAMCSADSDFWVDGIFKESKYKDITKGEWSEHKEFIGMPTPPEDANEKDFIGVSMDSSYLMPRSAFVAANMCYEHATIVEYNDHCFVIKKASKTPDVPYGKTFIAHTQIVITNTGNNTCHLVCSVEAEFPNGPPMVGRQIKSGMRAGTADLFVLIGETISKYADVFP